MRPRRAALHTESWPALGTTAVLRHADPADPAVRAAVEREIDAIDLAASRFRPDSELAALNAVSRAGGGRRRVSPLMHDALALAIRAAEISDGAVDPTLGESLVIAGYDRDWRELAPFPPSAAGPRRPDRRAPPPRRLAGDRGDR